MVKDIRAVISKKTKQKSEERDHDQDKDNVKNKEAATNVESDERAARGHWKHPLDFLFSCISVSVGLGSKYYFVIELLCTSDSMRFMKLQEGDLKQCCRLSLEIVCEIDD